MPDVRHLDTIVAAGVNDGGHFVGDWHERSRDGRIPIPYRACGKKGSLILRRALGAKRIHMLLSAPVGVAGRAVSGTVLIGSVQHQLTLDVDAWVLRTFELPREPSPGFTIQFTCRNPVVPDRFLRNGDGRELGWYISTVWQD